ncbi:hypothetical protein WN73_21415 [Bradyrhizobium sp. CCBAU 45394]|nr:hypothetical protein [Bradyrhizobium sp. CCBAU 45394]
MDSVEHGEESRGLIDGLLTVFGRERLSERHEQQVHFSLNILWIAEGRARRDFERLRNCKHVEIRYIHSTSWFCPVEIRAEQRCCCVVERDGIDG